MKGATIGERLRGERARLGKSQEEMAKAADIPIDTYRKYEGDSRTPGGEALTGLARMGIDVNALLAGDTLKNVARARDAVVEFISRRSSVSKMEAADLLQVAFERGLRGDDLEREFGDRFPVHAVNEPRAGYTYIPLHGVSAAAGSNGRIVSDEAAVDALAFKESWIRQELRRSPGDLRLIYIEGDSMEPDLRAGDIVLIDTTDTEARRDGVYVLRMDGALLVKQLQRMPGGAIRAVSKNAAYSPFDIQAIDLKNGLDFAIIGRVVWVCRRF